MLIRRRLSQLWNMIDLESCFGVFGVFGLCWMLLIEIKNVKKFKIVRRMVKVGATNKNVVGRYELRYEPNSNISVLSGVVVAGFQEFGVFIGLLEVGVVVGLLHKMRMDKHGWEDHGCVHGNPLNRQWIPPAARAKQRFWLFGRDCPLKAEEVGYMGRVASKLSNVGAPLKLHRATATLCVRDVVWLVICNLVNTQRLD